MPIEASAYYESAEEQENVGSLYEYACFVKDMGPRSFAEAMASESKNEWADAVRKEAKLFKDNDFFGFVDKPHDKKLIGGK